MQTLFFESLFGNLNYIAFYVEWFLGYYPFLADSLNFRVKQEGDCSNFCFLFIHLLIAIITVVYILINYTISKNQTTFLFAIIGPCVAVFVGNHCCGLDK